MKYFAKASILGLMIGALSACGGGSDGSGSSVQSPATAAGSTAPVTIATPAPSPTPTPTVTPAPTPTPTVTPTPTTTEQRVVLKDKQFYYGKEYFAYPAPWCDIYDKNLVVGRDLIDTISLLPSTFPNDVVITTKAPREEPFANHGCGVYGYHYMAYGHYVVVNPQSNIQPIQVKNIKTLVATFDMTLSTDGDFNLLTETFLTGKPKDWSVKTEVGFYNHSSAPILQAGAKQVYLGIYVDNEGRSWRVLQWNKFSMFIMNNGQDFVKGTLDVGAAFKWLMTKGILTGDEWFDGLATGIEPVSGNSTATYKTYSVVFN